MEKQPKQPQRVFPLEELQSYLVMKRTKDNPRKLNCQAPRLHLLFDLPSHTTRHYKIINYQTLLRKTVFSPPPPHFESLVSPPPSPTFKVASRSLKSKQKSKASRKGDKKKKRSKVVHLYSAFSIWICSKALYNVRFTPSGPEAYIQSGLCMLVLILPTPGGWKAE